MAFLKVIKGGTPGQLVELRGDQMLLGRHPNCQVVLDNQAVSRYHAQILQSHGSFYLEDLRSRNKTHLNGVPIEGRTELNDKDELKICDVEFSFHLKLPRTETESQDSSRLLPPQSDVGNFPNDRTTTQPITRKNEKSKPFQIVSEDNGIPLAESDQNSSILTTLNAGRSSHLRLGIKPEAKLRAILEIGKGLGSDLNLTDSLDAILEGLFRVFPQADEGFVLLEQPKREQLMLKATRNRSGSDATPKMSRTIVRQAMENKEAILSADAFQDPRFSSSKSVSDLEIRSMICAPLMGKKGKSRGVIQINTRDLGQQFSEEDLDVLASVASQAMLAIEYAYLHEEVLLRREMERELEFATQVQLGFLPRERPKLKGYEFADYYEPAQNVGGDYFDYVPLPDGRMAFALGDVAGKGVPAALLMARLYSVARYQFLTKKTVSAAMTGLNEEISSSGLGHRFITCIMAILDPKKGKLSLANAGHMSPVFRDASGKTKTISRDISGLPIGIVRNQKFKEITMEIKPGDLCVMYTDGISETMNAEKEIYGTHRVESYLATTTGPLEKSLKSLLSHVEDFSDGEGQRDDMCVLAMQRLQ